MISTGQECLEQDEVTEEGESFTSGCVRNDIRVFLSRLKRHLTPWSSELDGDKQTLCFGCHTVSSSELVLDLLCLWGCEIGCGSRCCRNL